VVVLLVGAAVYGWWVGLGDETGKPASRLAKAGPVESGSSFDPWHHEGHSRRSRSDCESCPDETPLAPIPVSRELRHSGCRGLQRLLPLLRRRSQAQDRDEADDAG